MMHAATTATMRLIVNGKAAGDPALREAVGQIRDDGVPLEVRVTWEGGDAARFAGEAVAEGVGTVIAAGGDGTINEVVCGVLAEDEHPQIAVGVVPYGTANDFASGCSIPIGDPLAALRLIVETPATPIDVGRVNGRCFINVASGGFGAEVTVNTPAEMKRALGGAAYTLMGVVTAAKMSPYHARLKTPEQTDEGLMIAMAVGNGRQCGGGIQVTPRALLNDGLLDVIVVHDVELADFGTLLAELHDVASVNVDSKYVAYQQLASFVIESDEPLQMNLDGEPIRDTTFHFELLSRRLRFVLPAGAPLVESAG